MGGFITKETKHVKLICAKCNTKVYIDYKKDVIRNLYCNHCIEKNYLEGYDNFWDVRCFSIEYK